jgi:ATP-binding cassette, subfamily F, member 1
MLPISASRQENSMLSAFSLSFPESACHSDENAFSCEDFTLTAPNQPLLVNASFKVVKGHRYGVLGCNGSGKTTFIRHLAARIFPLPATWDVLLVEQEATASEKSVLQEVLAADKEGSKLLEREKELLQELDDFGTGSSDDEDRMTLLQSELEKVIAKIRDTDVYTRESKAAKILAGLGFTVAAQNRGVEALSGGWRMRVNLAKALFIEPRLLLLDEPTNHLDLDAVLWLQDYLQSYKNTIMVISHDKEFLDIVATDIMNFRDKGISQYKGNYSMFLAMHEQQVKEEEKEYEKFERALKSCKDPKERDAVKAKYKHAKKPHQYTVKFKMSSQSTEAGQGIGLSEVSHSYTGHQPYVIEKCDFGVDTRSRIALVGSNGTGKSTVLKLLIGELEPVEGKINKNPQLRVEMFSQHFEEGLPLDLSPVEYILETASKYKNEDIHTPERARSMLGRFGLSSEHHNKLIKSCSGGQKARVAFAALSLRSPHILILDEPTNHLDIETVEALIEALKLFQGGLVVVSHDARLINELNCKLYICKNRKLVAVDGDFETYRELVLSEIKEREAEMEVIMQANREDRRKLYAMKLGKERLESVLNQGEHVAVTQAAPVVAAKVDTSKLVFNKKPTIKK